MRKKKKQSRARKKNYYTKKKKRISRSSRDYNSPHYRRWRDDIKIRDNYTCQWPGCLSRRQLQVHHIKTWAKYPALRFVPANGITLCKKCHDMVSGKEQDYEAFFYKLLEWQVLDKLKKYDNKNVR